MAEPRTKRKRRTRDRREATFLEHLEELRQRLIRCLAYVGIGTLVCWFFRKPLMEIAQYPLNKAGAMSGVEIEVKIFEVAGGLILSVHVALVAGIILSAFLWLWEAWRFIEPALEDHERDWIVWLLPAAVFLFLTGVTFCYWISPRAFAILLKFQQDLGAAPEFMLKSYLTFFLRLLLIFGVMFELPLVIMFLSAVGLVRSSWLAQYWRIAVVIIAVVCAIVTPTPDAVTLSFLAGPMIGLYLLSILLAKFVEKRRERREEEPPEEPPGPEAGPDEELPEEDPYAPYREGEESGALPEAAAEEQEPPLPEAPSPTEPEEEAQRQAQLAPDEASATESPMDAAGAADEADLPQHEDGTPGPDPDSTDDDG